MWTYLHYSNKSTLTRYNTWREENNSLSLSNATCIMKDMTLDDDEIINRRSNKVTLILYQILFLSWSNTLVYVCKKINFLINNWGNNSLH